MSQQEQLLPSEGPTRWAGAEEKLDIPGAAVSLAISMLGTGIVAFPSGFALCGSVVGPVAVLLLAFLAHLSYVCLIRCTDSERVTSYGALLQKLPRAWGSYTNAALWLLLILATTAYVLISADVIRSVVLRGDEREVPWFLHNSVLFALILLVVLPPCLLRTMHGLSLISAYCTFAIVAVVGFIVCQCLAIALDDPPAEALAPTMEARPLSVVLAVPIFSCAMFGHMNMSQVYAELKPAAKPRAQLVSLLACVGTAALYLLVGVAGYAAFGRGAMPDVVAQIAARHGETTAVCAMQGLLASFIVLKTPLLVLPLRSLSLSVLAPGADPNALSPARHVLLTAALLACVYVAAVALPDLDRVLEFLGALCVAPLCFVVPARVAWSLETPRSPAKCAALAAFGVAASALSFAAAAGVK